MREQKEKEQAIRAEGVIHKHVQGSQFIVKLHDYTHEVLAYLSGKISKHKIKIVPGDTVTVELSPYDLKRGRIVFRK